MWWTGWMPFFICFYRWGTEVRFPRGVFLLLNKTSIFEISATNSTRLCVSFYKFYEFYLTVLVLFVANCSKVWRLTDICHSSVSGICICMSPTNNDHHHHPVINQSQPNKQTHTTPTQQQEEQQQQKQQKEIPITNKHRRKHTSRWERKRKWEVSRNDDSHCLVRLRGWQWEKLWSKMTSTPVRLTLVIGVFQCFCGCTSHNADNPAQFSVFVLVFYALDVVYQVTSFSIRGKRCFCVFRNFFRNEFYMFSSWVQKCHMIARMFRWVLKVISPLFHCVEICNDSFSGLQQIFSRYVPANQCILDLFHE